jgi:hypothetical protein
MMICRSTTRRAGVSLMEVLVGFGIMAIGVTSVITLFPFAALTLGQALRDDRTITCAVTADGFLREHHLRRVVEAEQNGAISTEPYHVAFDNPGGGLPPPLPNQPSYPVALDPMGYAARSGRTDRDWIGDPLTAPTAMTLVPRRTLSTADPANNLNAIPLSQRLCSQIDGLTYNDDGQVSSNPADMRELRYNWMWVLQRPVNRDRYTVRMQVVVFDKRAHLYAPPKVETVLGGALFVPGETAITNVPAGTEIRKGSWVMDATILPAQGLRHAEFYRVVSVTEQANGTVALDVHKPIARPDGLINPAAPWTYQYTGTLVFMPAVADVYERPVMSASP